MIAAFSETYIVSAKTELLTSVEILWYSTPFVPYTLFWINVCSHECVRTRTFVD